MTQVIQNLSEKISSRGLLVFILLLKASLITILILRMFQTHQNFAAIFSFDGLLLNFILIGFLAQLVDGALGMAYGATCTSMLMGFGIPPAVASASVHTAEVFTTGTSGLSHIIMKNIDMKLFSKVVVTGVLGAMIGAYIAADLINPKYLKPAVSVYLVGLGIIILSKAFRPITIKPKNTNLSILGFFGGFLDAVGGGGWGPLVTSNLLNNGNAPRETIGTVNTAEFFIAFFSTGIFMIFIDIDAWQPIFGLVIGGIIAAPLGAILIKYLKPRFIMISIGVLVITLSLYNLSKLF